MNPEQAKELGRRYAIAARNSSSRCGDASDDEAAVERQPRVLVPQEIEAAVTGATGLRLKATMGPDVPPRPGTVTLLQPVRGERAANPFSIYVYSDPQGALSRLNAEPGSAYDRSSGVYWLSYLPERGPDADKENWYASKLYGANVLLVYFTPERQLDEEWRRLDRILLEVEKAR